MQQQTSEDKFSALPDAIIHQIFSPFDTRLVVQASVLSKRWRFLWKSIPNLTFNLDSYITTNSPTRPDFVDRVFFLRSEFYLQKLTLSCGEEELTVARLQIWLIAALRLHVQELHLELNPFEPFEIPREVFTSSHVIVLNLSRISTGMFGIRLPDVVSTAAFIKNMKLVSVKFPEGDEEEKIVLNCPVLENLVMVNCYLSHLNALIISPPLLESFEFQDQFDGVGHCEVTVSAPNLKLLNCTGPMFHDIYLESLSSLFGAYLDIYRMAYYAIEKEVYVERLMKVLAGIYNVKAITMSSSLLKTLTKLSDTVERLPDLLRNLKYMRLTIQWDEETCICPVASILEKLPHIEYLVWERNKTVYFQDEISKRRDACICDILESLPPDQALHWENKKEIWMGTTDKEEVSLSPSLCLFQRLKTIEIRNPRGFDTDLKIMEFILKRAVALEEIIINSTEDNLADFGEILLKLPRASSSVSVRCQ